MKRPLVLVGFCYLLTLAAAVFFGPHGSLFAFWFCLSGFAITLVWKRTRKAVVFPVALAAAATALGAFCLYSRVAVEPPRTLDGLNKTAEGTICELPARRYGRWYYVVRVDSMDGEDSFRPFKIRLSTQNAIGGAGPYSRIRGKIHLFLPTGGDGYSSRSYYASKGIMMFAYLYEHQKTEVFPPGSKPPYYYALRFRQKLLESIRDMLPPDEAGLVGGILLGDKTGLSEELISDFRIDGISHLLSVSGLHMATIAQLMIFLLLFFRVPKKPASAVAACGVFGFMAVTCFVPSVTRSGIMCLLFLAAPILSRRADPLNSLCAAVLAICLPNPYAAADVGLLLSFFATLGLILCAGPLAGRLNAVFDRIPVLSPLIQAVSGILSTSAAAALFTLPVILLNFGSVSLVAPLSNLLELVPSTLLMGSGAIAALLNLLFPKSFLVMPFALAAGLLAKYMRICAVWLADFPAASLNASRGFVVLWLAGTIFLFAAAFALAKGFRLFPHAACFSVILLLVGVLSFQISQRGITRVAVLDVGSDVSVVLTRGGHAAVVGCGSYNSGKVVSYLESENISRFDLLELLTLERDEVSCAAGLAERFHPVRIVAEQDSPADGFFQKASSDSSYSTLYQNHVSVSLWSDVQIDTAFCGKASAARICLCGVSVLVCPEETDLSQLPQEWMNPDFLVTDRIKEKDEKEPQAACTVFSVDQKALEKSAGERTKCRFTRTGGCGNIVLELRGERTLSIRRES
ncbi:MAG: ComEC/Rec2 family competence protein [Oscillospiraceae bacterium]|jgi:competence protein ComEC|nr:ComEC/Rec2 family competence protein [Oscillospiraceae bacterium]